MEAAIIAATQGANKRANKKKIASCRDKTLEAFSEFMEASDNCEHKGEPIDGIGCLCKLEKRWGVVCGPLECTL